MGKKTVESLRKRDMSMFLLDNFISLENLKVLKNVVDPGQLPMCAFLWQ